MSIEIGSKWVKDGFIVSIFDTFEVAKIKSVIYDDYTFKHVLTERYFLEQYKPYKPVYEYQWAYKRSTDSKWSISDIFYLDTPYLTRDEEEYQRLDFTKRERKQ